MRLIFPLIAILAAAALAACSVVLGPLNHDEGWYLLAGINSAGGMMPYRDYLFTQGPVMAAVYAAFSFLWAPFGVLGGRVFTLTLAAASLALWCSAAKRLAGRDAAILTFLLLALNPVYSYFTVIPKTYALSGLFIAAAFRALVSERRFRIEGAAVALALAAGTRLSLGILLAVVGLWLLCKKGPWLRFGIAGIIALAVIYAPFFLICPEQFIYSQTYHTARDGGGLFSWIVLRGGFVSRLLQGYFTIPVVLAAGLLVGRGKICVNPFIIAVSFFAVSALHFLTPFPYDDYQTPVMPLAAVFAAAFAARRIGTEKGEGPGKDAGKIITRSVLVLSLCFLISSPMLMNWMTVRQDRFWFEMKQKPDLLVLRETAASLRDAADGDAAVLLTQDAYLAVEARMSVPRGLEMGPFSLFPDLSDEDARKFNVHNLNTLRETIETTDAQFAALSGYAFAIACPSTSMTDPAQTAPLFAAISNRYDRIASVADFGQCHTTLTVWEKASQSQTE